VRRDDTLEDVMGRRDPYLRERIRNSTDQIAIGMGDIVAQMAVVAPELRRALAGVEQSLERSMRDVRERRRGRDDDRRYDRDDDYDYDR
jgi:hypothetical protein